MGHLLAGVVVATCCTHLVGTDTEVMSARAKNGIRIGDRVCTPDGHEWFVEFITRDMPAERYYSGGLRRKMGNLRVRSRERRLIAWVWSHQVTRLDWLDD